jgi:hypothetical protein
MRKQIVLLFLVGFFISNGQEIIVYERLIIDETKLIIEEYAEDEDYNKHFHNFYLSRDYCFEDKLNIFFNTKGSSLYSFNIKFINNTVNPELKLVSDYKEYDGSSIKTLTLYDYRLEINTLNPNLDDTIYGTIHANLTTMVHGTIMHYKISGSFRHVVGKVVINNIVDEFLTTMFEKKSKE